MASTIKVNKIEKVDGSTIELGGPSTAVTLACGATQSGFGRTGTVDWCTTAKTTPLTAVSGKGYFINTTGGAITVTLPSSPSAGDIVALKDYANTWGDACKAVTLGRGGSKINGVCADTALNTESQSVTLIYVDGTKGWQDIHDSTSDVSGNPGFIQATGGTITCTGDYKIHTFTGPGCFQVTNSFGSGVGAKVSYVVVAGGGGGGSNNTSTTSSAGGGAGGFREGKVSGDPYTASPLAAPDGLPVGIATYAITVGAGGAGGPGPSPGENGTNGNPSSFSTITSTGGGGGSGVAASPGRGSDGGSGGGAKQDNPQSPGPGIGVGNTPPVSPAQGTNGGESDQPGPSYRAGGGGGAGAVGGNASPSAVGVGGAGVGTTINTATGIPGPGPSRYYAGGGGGGKSRYPGQVSCAGAGGLGGGGAGGPGPGVDPSQLGGANTGGGGGGGQGFTNPAPSCGGTGGSGIVIIRYKYQ